MYYKQQKGGDYCPDVGSFSLGSVMLSDPLDGRAKNTKGNEGTRTYGLWNGAKYSTLPQLCDRSLCGQRSLSLQTDASYRAVEHAFMLLYAQTSVRYKMPSPRFQALRNASLELGCPLHCLHLRGCNTVQSLMAWSCTVFLQGLCFLQLAGGTRSGRSLNWAPRTRDCSPTSWKVSRKWGG